jgi:hypothetical protein
MTKWKFATMPCARGSQGTRRFHFRGAELPGVIFQRVTSVGDEFAQAGRSLATGIGKTRQLCKTVIGADQFRKKGRCSVVERARDQKGFANGVRQRVCSGREGHSTL